MLTRRRMLAVVFDPARVELRIEPRLDWGISVGTITHVHVLREECEIGLAKAKAIVDRCVYDGDTVVVEVAADRAARLVARLTAIPPPPRRTRAC